MKIIELKLDLLMNCNSVCGVWGSKEKKDEQKWALIMGFANNLFDIGYLDVRVKV